MSINLKMKKRRYTRTSVDEVIRLYQQGLNFSQIARELGCARNTVRAKIHQYIKSTGRGIPIRSKPGLLNDQVLEVLAMYEDGIKVKHIASHFNVSQSYVYSVIRKYKQ